MKLRRLCNATREAKRYSRVRNNHHARTTHHQNCRETFPRPQRPQPTRPPEFSWLLSGITLATKIIASHIHRAGLIEIMADTGRTNVQGEEVQKLDQIANETLVRCLGYRATLAF